MATKRRRFNRSKILALSIPDKANRILYIILIAMLLVVLRIWHLSVVQYDKKIEEARKPREKVVIEPAKRATIRDRFNIPLALNKVQYQAAIYYSQLRELPRVAWRVNKNGKKEKYFKRREYITNLSKLLGQELNLDPERLEDLIYSKAAFYYNVPFIIKDDISEKEFYRLKILEKDWPGIYVVRSPRRYYPQGKVAAEIIGYMGAINRNEYENILRKTKILEDYLAEFEAGNLPTLPPGIEDPLDVKKQLKELHEQAYTAKDYIGKTGIEGYFEHTLRGFHGKKRYYSDARGNFLRELPGSKAPRSGQRILLTISAELQEYAEQMLALNEKLREEKIIGITPAQPQHTKHGWIKGGAIVAMDPNNGEIVAMASYPRFDPNDFILSGNPEIDKQKNAHILRWFETDQYVGEIWDQKRPLEKEVFDNVQKIFHEERLSLTWELYLNFILPKQHPIQKAFEQIKKVYQAIEFQLLVQQLLELSQQDNVPLLINTLYSTEEHQPITLREKLTAQQKETVKNTLLASGTQYAKLKVKLDGYVRNLQENFDKVLLLDLCRMLVPYEQFTPGLIRDAGYQNLTVYHQAAGAMSVIKSTIKKMTKDLFHDYNFKPWREANEKSFLKEKRAYEKAEGLYPKPYIDYLDKKEEELFNEFWKENSWCLILAFLKGQVAELNDNIQSYTDYFLTWHKELSQQAHQSIEWRPHYEILQNATFDFTQSSTLQYLQTLRSFDELDRPLLGRYKHLRSKKGVQLEKHLAAAFYPNYGYGYGRSHTYRQATTQGSIFKVVTAYAALMQRMEKLKQNKQSLSQLNPLEIIDREYKQGSHWYVGYFNDGQPIPRLYKGGRVPKSLSREIGKIDLIKALEHSSNPYFALLAGEHLESPEDLADTARLFGYGTKSGVQLACEYSGKIPTDLAKNKTGLYAMAIGQHSLVVTPLQSAAMLSAIANGGKLYKPKIVHLTAGKAYVPEKNSEEAILQDYLQLSGLETSPFIAHKPTKHDLKNKSPVAFQEPELRWTIPLPHPVRNMILKGMQRVVYRTQEEGLRSLIKLYAPCPEAIKCYMELKDQLLGKSSSAETVEHLNLDLHHGLHKSTHIWFGAISFDHSLSTQTPDIMVAKDHYGTPELVVIVYLRYGMHGKDGGPLAAQIVKKWREIKKSHEM